MIALALALAAPVTSLPPGIYGGGKTLCSDLKPENMQRIGDYVMGFWSGMNVAANTPSVGHSTDAPGILTEVMKACAAAPTLSLGLATLAVHMRFEREKR